MKKFFGLLMLVLFLTVGVMRLEAFVEVDWDYFRTSNWRFFAPSSLYVEYEDGVFPYLPGDDEITMLFFNDSNVVSAALNFDNVVFEGWIDYEALDKPFSWVLAFLDPDGETFGYYNTYTESLVMDENISPFWVCGIDFDGAGGIECAGEEICNAVFNIDGWTVPVDDITLTLPVPEPGAMFLFGLGVVAFFIKRIKRF